MPSTLRAAFHISAFGWYTFIVNYLAAKDGEELPAGLFVYGGPWKYLTFLNLLLQMMFFGLAAVNDLQPGKKAESVLNRWKDLLFSVFAFPVGTFVVVFFWTVFAYDRELIYPATIDAFFPPWINHAMHTSILPVLLGEVLVQPHTYPQTRHALAALSVVGLAYLSWIVWIYLAVGVWAYPLLGHFSATGLLGFFFFNMAVASLLYLLGDRLNSQIWSETCYIYSWRLASLCGFLLYIAALLFSSFQERTKWIDFCTSETAVPHITTIIVSRSTQKYMTRIQAA
ncbi:androgen-dependent TFPI-regulating protein-like isoform X2 [Xiphophorus maculatus]|nr:androgen-dependent TFPI-regulating protein-like isoform X2 [Xiphophorus maculatus]XP_023182703.1 androgen-dependent TFPI-regulating protein-like isoform X2 [Xiphophorus maculatus]